MSVSHVLRNVQGLASVGRALPREPVAHVFGRWDGGRSAELRALGAH